MALKQEQSKHDGKNNVQSGKDGDKNVQNSCEGDKNVQSSSEGDKNMQRSNEGLKNVQIKIEGDKNVQSGYEGGMNVQSGYEGGMNVQSGYEGGMNVQSGYEGGMNMQSGYEGGMNMQSGYEGETIVQIKIEGDMNMQSGYEGDENAQIKIEGDMNVQSGYEGDMNVQSGYEGDMNMQSGYEGDMNMQSGYEGDMNVQSGYEGDMQSSDQGNKKRSNEGEKKMRSNNNKKKVLKKITIALKKEIVEKHDRGVRVTDLASEYKMAKSTISTILKNKDAIKGADVAKGVTMLTKQRTQVLEEVEKLLLVWLNEKQLAGDSVNEAMICEKARKLHGDLLQRTPSTSAASEEFKASRGWFAKFRKRSGIHCVIRHGEDSRSDKEAVEAYKKEFAEFVKAEGYIAQQVFSCNETGLFWKRMPKRTYITQEEKALPGHKPMKDKLTLLLCANASADLKIKPLLVYHSQTPRAFKEQNVNKARLPVMWRANAKAWVTRQLFMEWLHDVFAPTVKKYFSDNQLPERCLLLMDNAPAHPPALGDAEYDFIKVKFLPPKITPLLKPMDQQVICSFKKLYTKALFTMCFNVTEETSLTLKELWKKHFNVLYCINLIDKAWQDVTYWTLNSAWKKLWPECVTEHDCQESDAEVVEEILSMGKSMGLEVDGADIEELVQDHKVELTTEELAELQSEQQKALVKENSTVEQREEVSTEVIKSIMEKWNECHNFFEKHHPNIMVTNRVLNLMNHNVVSHFWREMQHRKKQVSLDRFYIKTEPGAKRQRREETTEGDLPDVFMEEYSPSKQ